MCARAVSQMSSQDKLVDLVLFGGGIAGLWTLARLRKAGYRAVLFESRSLGGIQSIASQGIIHGGTKYALTGKLTGSAKSIGEMPAIWRACLAGGGELDLSDVRVLTGHQLLWSTGSLVSGMAGFFAGKVMQSRMQTLAPGEYPPPFDTAGFNGSLYRLQEPVLDTASLAESLVRLVGRHCYALPQLPQIGRSQGRWQVQLPNGQVLEAGQLVLTAGSGNADLLKLLGRQRPRMQTRPLHMLMLRGELPPLFAHCLGASANPRLTITSNRLHDGQFVWYLGGQVAEEGVTRDHRQQLAAGRQELAELLPWVDLAGAQWASLPIARAEVRVAGGRRPDDSFVQQDDGVITCWPTKLAFAPRLATQVLARLPPPGADGTQGMAIELPRPPISQQPWNEDIAWS